MPIAMHPSIIVQYDFLYLWDSLFVVGTDLNRQAVSARIGHRML